MRIPETVIDPQAGNADSEELVNTFESLLAASDPAAFFRILGLGRFSLSARRNMRAVFTALCAGLWRLALKRAVPDRCDAAFERYLASLRPDMKESGVQEALVRDLASFLPSSGSEDFTPTAREIFRRAGREPDQAGLVGMALFLRRLYDYFFNHLM